MILLSFDTEEFDVPRENGVEWNTLTEGMEVSKFGTTKILDVLKENGVRATFFCTSNFATHAPEIMQRIINEGHEVAAHGCDHWTPKPEDVFRCKEIIENEYGVTINGYRQPRMFPVSDEDIQKAGYKYNTSLNPCFLPGKYMHLTDPRTPFWKDKVLQIPASVTPWFRFPLFWLSLHDLPYKLYEAMCNWTLKHDGHFTTYFHPWEYYPLGEHPEFKTKAIVNLNAGEGMVRRLDRLIKNFKQRGHQFITYSEFTEKQAK